MYSLPDYGRMLGEEQRFGAYRRALERAVSAGDTVIDLGAGPGIFALLAARAGASKVYAIEPDPVVEMVNRLARANDLEQIVAVSKLSTDVLLEEKADVLISDLRGVLPTFTEHLPSIIDARRRLLAPGGALIPRRDHLWAAPVRAPLARKRHLGGYLGVAGLDLTIAANQTSHLWTRVELEAEALAARPEKLGELDYLEIDSPNFKATCRFTLNSQASPDETEFIDGFAVWFDAEIDEQESFSNAPSSDLIYGQAFFPFQDPMEIRMGDELELRFGAYYMPNDDYLYRWSGELERAGAVAWRFNQSGFHGSSVTAADVKARASGHIPRLSEAASIDARILTLLDGRRSLAAAADLLRDAFPGAFEDHHTALRRVSAIADRYASE